MYCIASVSLLLVSTKFSLITCRNELFVFCISPVISRVHVVLCSRCTFFFSFLSIPFFGILRLRCKYTCCVIAIMFECVLWVFSFVQNAYKVKTILLRSCVCYMGFYQCGSRKYTVKGIKQSKKKTWTPSTTTTTIMQTTMLQIKWISIKFIIQKEIHSYEYNTKWTFSYIPKQTNMLAYSLCAIIHNTHVDMNQEGFFLVSLFAQ